MVTFPSGGYHSGSLAIADFNGDGKPDIAVSNFYSGTISVFLNQGGGQFSSPVVTTLQIPNTAGGIAVGDFNEDGRPDLIVATVAGDQVDLVLLGNGDGTFTQVAPIPNSFGFSKGLVADFNRDKHLDFVGCSNGNISIARGNGDGTFQPVSYLPAGPSPNSYFGCAAADFNGDGKLDVLGADFTNDPDLILYAGNGDGTFQVGLVIASGNDEPTSISMADFGTGTMDILVGFESGAASYLSGNGDGGFSGSGGFASGSSNNLGATVLAVDLNNDGKIDAVATSYSVGTLQLVLNSSGSGFQASTSYNYGLAAGLADVATGDFNGDGLPDVVVVNSQTNQVTVLLSQK